MTTNWTIEREWAGKTVAVLASGPNMSQAVADSVRGMPTIAINDTWRLAPWADFLVALDRDFWLTLPPDAVSPATRRVIGAPCDVDALYAGMWYEWVQLAPNHRVEIHNSGLAAIRIAQRLGASKIMLFGFAPELGTNFLNDETNDYFAVAGGLAAVIADLRAAGVEVELQAPPAKPKARKGEPVRELSNDSRAAE